MSIFDKIKNAIFGNQAHAAPMPGTSAAEPAAHPTSTSAPLAPAPSATSPSTTTQPTSASAPAATTGQAPSASAPVDIEPILDAAVKKNGQKLEWRNSIVDLMKALDLDSSLASRKELAAELHYTGDTDDSAAMNIWLHKALMKKLAENGGKVPAELAD